MTTAHVDGGRVVAAVVQDGAAAVLPARRRALGPLSALTTRFQEAAGRRHWLLSA